MMWALRTLTLVSLVATGFAAPEVGQEVCLKGPYGTCDPKLDPDHRPSGRTGLPYQPKSPVGTAEPSFKRATSTGRTDIAPSGLVSGSG